VWPQGRFTRHGCGAFARSAHIFLHTFACGAVETSAADPTFKKDRSSSRRGFAMRAGKPHVAGRERNAQVLRHLDEMLDAALIETFPASDPIAVGRATATEPAARRSGKRGTDQGDKVHGPSPKASSSRAAATPAATSARPTRKVQRARS
jgi:hypothetical protein